MSFRPVRRTVDSRSLRAGRDTGPAKLPALQRVVTGNQALDRQLELIRERLEVREGARGNDGERVVTQRELIPIAEATDYLQKKKEALPGEVVIDIGGGMSATLAIEKFQDLIRATKLFQDMQKRLDDPSRFDDLPEKVRQELLKSLSELAAKQGAKITRHETVVNERFRALTMTVKTLTAAVDRAASGVREVAWASAEADHAQAGKIAQIEASLGNYYQDGTPGRALLEQQMTATADRIDGLSAQYTLKVQAGGAIAGIGVAATEVDGVPDSAVIIQADKFAIVGPDYNAGLTNTPSSAHIPFGVDSNGIYMNQNVYLKGSMFVDAGGQTLGAGLRGSVILLQSTGAWSDTTARNLVWQKIGKSGSAPNNHHLVIGDTVTIGSTSRMWNGTSWVNTGVFIRGDAIVDGTVAASKINTTGLEIRGAEGQLLFRGGSNIQIPASVLGNAPKGAEITNSDSTTEVTVNGQKLKTSDFVNHLSKINSSNISTFMSNAAIGNAYIGNAAVSTLKIAGQAVTVSDGQHWNHVMWGQGDSTFRTYGSKSLSITGMSNSDVTRVLIRGVVQMGTDGTGWSTCASRMVVNGVTVNAQIIDSGNHINVHDHIMLVQGNAVITVSLQFFGHTNRVKAEAGTITIEGLKR